ncbi:MAG: fibronectin type III domain-containing protein [Bacteroidia bacterium]|nr:fibronectin type III domain-containing protein [Bacteroidia bacterium]MDW8157679.1 fibronectin type III domain-containing protein [Bacteroidia bacterium]
MMRKSFKFFEKKQFLWGGRWAFMLWLILWGSVDLAAQSLCPTPPNAVSIGRCGRGPVVFTATMGSIPGSGMRLYNAATGGTLLDQTTRGPQFILTAPDVSQTTQFWIASFVEGCESGRIPVVASIGPSSVPTPIINATTVGRCGPGPVNFLVQNNLLGAEVRLYTQSVGGEPILRSPSQGLVAISTPFLTQSANFWIALHQSGCESERVLVHALITNPLPEAPISAPVSRCGVGNVKITAHIGIQAGNEVRLYDAPFGGSLLDVDESFPYEFNLNLTSSRIFWLAAAANGCEGPRVAVSATVHPLPDKPIAQSNARCQEGRVPFSAQMGNIAGTEIRLYTSSSGGAPIYIDNTEPYEVYTPVLQTTTTFWIASASAFCEGSRISVVATILPQIPAAPSVPVAMQERCEQGSVVFTASMSAPGGEDIRLFDAPFGGRLLQRIARTTAELATPSITTNTDFWISVGAGICEGPRVKVSAHVTPIRPAAPVVSNPIFPRCGIGSVTFTASLVPIPGQVMRMSLYSTPTGGIPISTVDFAPYQLQSPPFLTSVTSYWLAASVGACESPRTLVIADVAVNTPLVPSINSLMVSRCGAGSVAFSATQTSVAGRDFRLYTEQGILVASSSNNPAILSTPALTATQSFILVSGNGACESPKTRVTAVINQLPEPPIALNPFRCGAGELTLSFQTSSVTRQVLLHRSLIEPPILVDNTPPFSFLLNLTQTQTFFAIAQDGACQSSPVVVNVVVGRVPSIGTIQTNAPVCNRSPLSLSVELQPGVNYRWTLPNGNTINAPSIEIFSVTPQDAGFYSVVAISEGCTSLPQSVNVVVRPTPTLSLDKIDIPTPPGNALGTILASATGGQPMYIYTLNNISRASFSTVSFPDLPEGTYTVRVTDSQGCSDIRNIRINRVACDLSATATVTDVLCKGQNTGKIDITVRGGTLPYRFSWSNGSTTEDIENLAAGNYTGRITDKNGCTISATLTVQEPASALEISLTGNGVSCVGCTDGLIIATARGGVPPYRYFLNNSLEQITSAFSGLAAGTYTVTVRDLNFCDASASFTILGPGFTDCNIPPSPAINALSTQSARITWQPAVNATQYQIGYKKVSEPFFNNVFVTSNTYTFNNLEPFTEYEVRVRTYCANGGVTEYSPIIRFFTAPTEPCNVPGRIELGSISSTEAVVYWGGGVGVSNFEVQFKTAESINWQSFTTSNANYTFRGLSSNQGYQVRVRRVCGNGLVSSFTEVFSFQTLVPRPCITPSNLNVDNIVGTTARISWTDAEPSQATEIEWRVRNGGSSWNRALAQQGTTFLLTGLLADTEYEVRIRKVCVGSFSDYTLPIRFVSGSGCLEPSNIVAREVESTNATINWSAIIAAQGYEIFYRELGAPSWQRVTSNTNVLVLANLRPNTTYQLQVRTICDAINSSALSPIFAFTTLAATCRPPESLTLTPSTNSVTLSWPAVANAQFYQVAYRLNNANASWIEFPTSATTTVISGLVRGTEYQVRLRANCNGVFSAWSNTYLFNTTSFRIGNFQEKIVRVYPNPLSDKLFVQSEGATIEAVEIYDLQGSLITRIQSEDANSLLEVDARFLVSGIYVVRVLNENEQEARVFRIIKQ